MADALDAVSPDVDARKRALLEAVASGGTAGLKAFEDSEKAMQAARQQSIDRAAQRAALIGGPEAQGFESMAAGQYDRRLGDVATARGTFTEDMARRGGAHKNYLDQVAAAVPLVRADTDRTLALKRLEAENDAAEKAAKDISIDSLLGMATEAQAGARDEIESDVATGALNMAAGAQNMLQRILPFGKKANPAREIPAQPATVNGGVRFNPRTGAVSMPTVTSIPARTVPARAAKTPLPKLARKDVSAAKSVANQSTTDVAMDLGRQLGVPEEKLYGLKAPGKQASVQAAQAKLAPAAGAQVTNVAKWAKTDEQTAQKIVKDPEYHTARSWALAWLDPTAYDLDDDGNLTGEDDAYNGKTPWEAFVIDLAGLSPQKDRTKRALLAEFESMFRSSGLR